MHASLIFLLILVCLITPWVEAKGLTHRDGRLVSQLDGTVMTPVASGSVASPSLQEHHSSHQQSLAQTRQERRLRQEIQRLQSRQKELVRQHEASERQKAAALHRAERARRREERRRQEELYREELRRQAQREREQQEEDHRRIAQLALLRSQAHTLTREDICTACRETLVGGKALAIPSCFYSHALHLDCYRTLKRHSILRVKCPTCRSTEGPWYLFWDRGNAT